MMYRYLFNFFNKLQYDNLPDNTYTLNGSIDRNQKVDESEIQVLRMDEKTPPCPNVT